MSLPTIDRQLEEPLLTIAEHLRRNSFASIAAGGLMALPLFGPQVLQMLSSITPDFSSAWASMPLLVNEMYGAAVGIQMGLLGWYVVGWVFLFWYSFGLDRTTDEKLKTTLALYVEELKHHREHARERMLHDGLKEHDADEICAVLENHIFTGIVNTYKLRARKHRLAWYSLVPWLLLTFIFCVWILWQWPVEQSQTANEIDNARLTATIALLIILFGKGYRFARNWDYRAVDFLRRFA